jgi:hypothetical protein
MEGHDPLITTVSSPLPHRHSKPQTSRTECVNYVPLMVDCVWPVVRYVMIETGALCVCIVAPEIELYLKTAPETKASPETELGIWAPQTAEAVWSQFSERCKCKTAVSSWRHRAAGFKKKGKFGSVSFMKKIKFGSVHDGEAARRNHS